MTSASSAARQRVVHGDDLLYEFFQSMLAQDDEGFAGVPLLLLQTMGVWLPLEVYKRWPILLPWVVRDPDCRAKPSLGRPERWSSPDTAGYLRDDNSLIKSLPRSLSIRAPRGRKISGARLGTEFVAAHVWRTLPGSPLLASRVPGLNSFVPNLVWLPGQIAKLTDREGGVVQQTAQALSWHLYHDAPVEPHLADLVKESWSKLSAPTREITPSLPAEMNWFEPTPKFFHVREQRLVAVIQALRRLRAGHPLEHKVVTTRYSEGLPSVSQEARDALLHYLERFQPRVASA